MEDPNVQKEWADEFDELFLFIRNAIPVDYDNIKAFIRETLASHNNSLVALLEEKKTEHKRLHGTVDCEPCALGLAQELIKNSLTNPPA